jgi:hypothetical protein
MASRSGAARLLGKIAKTLGSLPEVRIALRDSKTRSKKRLKSRDFIWKELVGSIGSWGGTRGSEALEKDKRWDYKNLCALGSHKKRACMLEKILVEFSVNRARSKAPLLAKNFEIVHCLGGPKRVKRLLLDMPWREKREDCVFEDFSRCGTEVRKKYSDGWLSS